MLASVLVPLLGHLLAYYGEANYERFLALSSFLIGSAHVIFLVLKQQVGSDGVLANQWMLVMPCLTIGCGHALQATVSGPLVNKIVSKKLIPKVFSLMKITEGCILAAALYVYGHVR